MNTQFGINISGYINKAFGLGVAVRANINAMKAAQIPFAVNDFNIKISENIGELATENSISRENPYPVNLVQINPDMLGEVFANVSPEYFKDKYNIAFWAWELENFPEASKPFLRFFNEIWVPSSFCSDAVSKVSSVPVIKIMHSIQIGNTPFTRKDFNLPEDKFIFMTMFDYHSSIDRKNPIGAIDAYEKAFGKNNADTLLLIKTSISKEFPAQKQRLTERIGDNQSIVLIEEILDQDKLYSLINCCDSFVSLHRSEGFGLTMAEAMYLGKPVIATAYSANTEFMNLNNSFPVKYDLIKTGNLYSGSTDKDIWADPDTDHAAELMSTIYNDKSLAGKIAKKGQDDVRNFLAPANIGEKINQRLKIIDQDILPNLSKSSSNEATLLQFEIKTLKEKLEKIRSLKPVQWKIKIKNLKNKLTGKDRKYFWED
ncbi:glycosyltransferase involved in cell wall biosynthesis [Chryseobacterium defluvii]|uniref:Glycosyltransferase involved in cell wall biosynthesis n=1 Tax=Chryseobacterium defluvii TaxID=160396 RepID=A0A840KG65_9FLAO|nr:glycosyltransferase [Chryseobacterium defluvii]MBB4807645.1 glycosyltransferase involved in cell wall biosynthesis [Chryseobacterium defluvii]